MMMMMVVDSLSVGFCRVKCHARSLMDSQNDMLCIREWSCALLRYIGPGTYSVQWCLVRIMYLPQRVSVLGWCRKVPSPCQLQVASSLQSHRIRLCKETAEQNTVDERSTSAVTYNIQIISKRNLLGSLNTVQGCTAKRRMGNETSSPSHKVKGKPPHSCSTCHPLV